ncbi:hypothetical protein EWM64_g3018 [Hericium alpestre]|uniref:Uncharacterized protein n=1 Tax=Hericium alpestre TaxID=135208 RepID=A0A4Z0A500_9AGAM|nr:hypothetical protein EWM64_g3018 [Hericium alpestre]
MDVSMFYEGTSPPSRTEPDLMEMLRLITSPRSVLQAHLQLRTIQDLSMSAPSEAKQLSPLKFLSTLMLPKVSQLDADRGFISFNKKKPPPVPPPTPESKSVAESTPLQHAKKPRHSLFSLAGFDDPSILNQLLSAIPEDSHPDVSSSRKLDHSPVVRRTATLTQQATSHAPVQTTAREGHSLWLSGLDTNGGGPFDWLDPPAGGNGEGAGGGGGGGDDSSHHSSHRGQDSGGQDRPPHQGGDPEGGDPDGGDSNCGGRGGWGGGHGGGGSGGGGGDGDPGGGNGGAQENGNLPRALRPYTNEPRMKLEIKREDLPVWNGDKRTAIDFFFRIITIARVGGRLLQEIPVLLPLTFLANSTIAGWYLLLSEERQAAMKQHLDVFLENIRECYLGDEWSFMQRTIFDSMFFCQHGHEREKPIDYVQRKATYARILGFSDDGGPREVRIIMGTFPVYWRSLIHEREIPDTAILSLRVTEWERELVHLWEQYKKEHTEEPHPFYRRSAYIMEEDDPEVDRHPGDIKDPVIASAYASLQQRTRTRLPPKEGYKFPKEDSTVSKVRLPPSPCKVCGSNNHWDKECPRYQEWVKLREVRRSEWQSFDRDEPDGVKYESVYQAFLSEKIFDLYDPLLVTQEEYLEEGRGSPPPHESCLVDEKTPSSLPEGNGSLPPRQDDQTTPAQPQLPPAYSEFQEIIDVPPSRNSKPGFAAQDTSVLAVRGHVGNRRAEPIDICLDSCVDVTLILSDFYHLLARPPKVRQGLKLRLSQLTIAGKAKVEGYILVPIFLPSLDGPVLRIMVEAYIIPGMTVPFLLGEDFQQTYELSVNRNLDRGTIVSFRNCHHELQAVAVTPYRPPRIHRSMFGVQSYVHVKEHRRSKNKRHRCLQNARQYEKEIRAAHDYRILPGTVKSIEVVGQFPDECEWLIQRSLLSSGKDDFFITPNTLFSSCHPIVPVTNHTTKPCFIHKGDIMGTVSDPTTFFDAPDDLHELEQMIIKSAQITQLIINLADSSPSETSHAEPSEGPSRATDPDEMHLQDTGQSRPATGQPLSDSYTPQSGPVANYPQGSPPDLEASPVGLKMAELPDPTYYPSDHLRDLLDVGSLLDTLREPAWAMLERRVRAFGFDGRLGHHPVKARIRIIEDHPPISVPMYGSSLRKREVIEAQVRQWFEQDVIEASKSPWSAPVVIAYRNGKARFCVDY